MAKQSPGKRSIVVAGVGDSITWGCCCGREKSDSKYGFMHILERRLRDRGYKFFNFGVKGATAIKVGHAGIFKSSYWKRQEFRSSLAVKPDVVLFMFGTNDADRWWRGGAQHFLRDWEELLTLYVNLPNSPKIVTMIPPPVLNQTCSELSKRDPYGLQSCKRHGAGCVINCIVPSLVRQGAREAGIAAPLDLNFLLGGPNHTSRMYMHAKEPDALTSPSHPTCSGHFRIAERIFEKVFPSEHMSALLPEESERWPLESSRAGETSSSSQQLMEARGGDIVGRDISTASPADVLMRNAEMVLISASLLLFFGLYVRRLCTRRRRR